MKINLSKLINMKILVYGSNGWIGNQFAELLKSKNIVGSEELQSSLNSM